MKSLHRHWIHILLVATACSTAAHAAPRHAPGLSEASALSGLLVAVSVAAPVGLLVEGASLVVRGVEASAAGTVWVLERTSDGARASVQIAGHAAGGASVALGSAIAVTACSVGWLLHHGGHALAFVPNEVGRALLHHERVSR